MISRRPDGPSPLRWATFFASTVLMTTLTFLARPMITYRAIEVGVPAAWLGLFVVSYAVLPIVLAVSTGRVTDRRGEAAVLVTGAVLMLAATGGLAVGGAGFAALVGYNALLGTGQLLMVVGQQAFVAGSVRRHRLDAVFGYYMLAVSTGQAIGPLAGAVLGGPGRVPDTGSGFAGALVVACLLLVVTLPVGSSGHPRTDRRPGAPRGDVPAVLRTPRFGSVMAASIATTAATELILVYLPALGTELGISAGAVGVLLSLRAVAAMLSRFLAGTLVRHFGRVRILSGSILVSAAALAAIPLPLPLVAVGVVVVVAGAGLAIGPPLTMAWLSEATPPHLRGTAISVRVIGNRMGQVVIPAAAALVAAQTGSAGVFWMLGAALGACVVPASRLGRSRG